MADSQAPKEVRHFFDEPRNVKGIIYALYAVCTLVIALDLVVHRHASFKDGVFGQELWFGFYGVYGFVSCVVLVLAATQLRKILMRGEDYYD